MSRFAFGPSSHPEPIVRSRRGKPNSALWPGEVRYDIPAGVPTLPTRGLVDRVAFGVSVPMGRFVTVRSLDRRRDPASPSGRHEMPRRCRPTRAWRAGRRRPASSRGEDWARRVSHFHKTQEYPKGRSACARRAAKACADGSGTAGFRDILTSFAFGCHANGVPDECDPEYTDVGLFVSQVLAPVPDPVLVCMLDADGDGVLSGMDVSGFVERLIGS